jgi:hypothetical protein
VDAASGITRITREHLAVAVALEVPTALVVTKADAVRPEQLQQLLGQLRQLMQPVLQCCGDRAGGQHGGEHTAAAMLGASSSSSSSEGLAQCGVPVVQREEQAAQLAASLSQLHSATAEPTGCSFQQALFPVFVVSCVTGAGVPLLHAFLSHLQPLSPSKHSGVAAAASSSSSSGGMLQQALNLPAAAAAAPPPPAAAAAAPRVKGSSQLWGVAPEAPHSKPSSSSSSSAAAPALQAAAAATAAPGLGQRVGGEAAGHFQVVHTYEVEGVGAVVSGIAVSGEGPTRFDALVCARGGGGAWAACAAP